MRETSGLIQPTSEQIHGSTSGREDEVRKEITQIYERHFGDLVAYAERYVRSNAVARDIVQEVILHVLERSRSEPSSRFRRAYYFTAVKHQAFKWLEHRRVVEENTNLIAAEWGATSSAPDNNQSQESLARDLDEAISRLTENEEEVIERIRINGEPYIEVAEAMNTKLNTTRTHYRRAIHKLRRWLAPKWRPNRKE